MKTVWTNGLTPDNKEDMRNAFKASGRLRERLTQIIEDKINAANKVRITKDLYDQANWAYLQADAVGYERALQEVISLIEEGK